MWICRTNLAGWKFHPGLVGWSILKHPGCPIYASRISQMVKSGVVVFFFPRLPYSLSGAMLNFQGVSVDYFVSWGGWKVIFSSPMYRLFFQATFGGFGRWTWSSKLLTFDFPMQVVKFRECDRNTAAFVWQVLSMNHYIDRQTYFRSADN